MAADSALWEQWPFSIHGSAVAGMMVLVCGHFEESLVDEQLANTLRRALDSEPGNESLVLAHLAV